MTVLSPLSVLTTAATAVFYWFAHEYRPLYLTVGGLFFFIVSVVVTVVVEVIIIKRIVTWTAATLPANWEQQRDKWQRNHIFRVVSGLAGVVLLLCAAIL